MPKKQVNLSNGQSFDSVGAAKDFFKQILNAGPNDVELVGDEAAMVMTLYRDYCASTNWPNASEPVSCFRGHQSDTGYTTTCFKIRMVSGDVEPFSYDRAVSAITK